MRPVIVAFVLCFLTSARTSADQVTLQNGDRLTGSIVKSDAKTLLVRTGFAGDVNIKWEAVTSIESSQPLHRLEGRPNHCRHGDRFGRKIRGGHKGNRQGGDFLVAANPTPPPPTISTPQPALTRKTGEADVGEELNTKISGRTTLSERSSLFPNVSDLGNYRTQFDITAATKLKTWLGWQISYSDVYITDPPNGLKGNDQVLSTGLRLTLGKGTF